MRGRFAGSVRRTHAAAQRHLVTLLETPRGKLVIAPRAQEGLGRARESPTRQAFYRAGQRALRLAE
ncbi:MAG TPA: hypothetical protein VK524_04525 [Polyangiaceae bacterium]|nr:hypothetical protein [Polyangiaceae bacterium]